MRFRTFTTVVFSDEIFSSLEKISNLLFERYSDMVYRIAISYGNQVSLAEDIVQEVFLRFLKKKPHFKNSEHEKAWFIRVTMNCCKSMVSSAWMKRIRPLEDAEQVAVAFRHKEEEELYGLMAKLPAIYRTVLYLRYYEEYQVKEIKLKDGNIVKTCASNCGSGASSLTEEYFSYTHILLFEAPVNPDDVAGIQIQNRSLNLWIPVAD